MLRNLSFLFLVLVGCESGSYAVATANLDLPDGGCFAETEVCNGMDDDCDGSTDEGVSTLWWADCDGDGYAPVGAVTAGPGCAVPPSSTTGCDPATQAGWTDRDPYVSADCQDYDARAYPGATVWQSTEVVHVDFVEEIYLYDFDCDYESEQKWTAIGGCAVVGGSCVSTQGWASTVAACGATGTWVQNCDRTCTARTNTRQQTCR
jgi:hypothetical protein